MKMKNILTVITITFLNTVSVLAQTGTYGSYFTHQCRDTNQFMNYTFMYHPLLNGDSTAMAIITPHSISGGVEENFHTGLWYNNNLKRWTIYNEAGSSDTVNLYNGFNVFIPGSGSTVFKHTATVSNVFLTHTIIDNPATNGKPNALLYLSHNWGVSGGVYNNKAVGVFYDDAKQKWGIFNENLTAFPVGAVYNVFVVESSNANAFIHTTGPTPAFNNYLTLLNETQIPSDATLFITHNLSPYGVTNNVYNTSPVGVAQKSFDWLITNRDKAPMDSGMAFNIFIADDVVGTGVNTLGSSKEVKVYPNPASNMLNISYEISGAGTVSINLYAPDGRSVSELRQEIHPAGTFTANVPIQDVAPGIYLLEISTKDYKHRQQVIITK